TLRVATVCDLFLEHSQKHLVPDSYRYYRDFLQDFCDLYGTLLVQDLKPLHVSRWLDSHPGRKGEGSGTACLFDPLRYRRFSLSLIDFLGCGASTPPEKVRASKTRGERGCGGSDGWRPGDRRGAEPAPVDHGPVLPPRDQPRHRAGPGQDRP